MDDHDTNLEMINHLFHTYMAGSLGMFKKIDTNGDGRISEQELKEALRGVSDIDVKKYLEEADRDGDSHVSFLEFVNILALELIKTNCVESSHDSDSVADMTWSSLRLCLRGIRKFFNEMDTNSNGQNTAAKMKAFQEWQRGNKVSDSEAKELIDCADHDGDGVINFEEFAMKILGELWDRAVNAPLLLSNF